MKDVEQDDSFEHREDYVHSEDSMWRKELIKKITSEKKDSFINKNVDGREKQL